MSVWHLDLDDEITDAVARLRAAQDDRVVLVIPAGSRVGSGRINFRLLAREAEARNLTVALVSGDAQVRALGASAGLTAHATVADAERALGLTDEPESADAASADLAPDVRVSAAVSAATDPATGAVMAVAGEGGGSLLHRRREGYAVTPRTATAAAGEETGAVTVLSPGPGDGARVVRRGPSTRRRVATWGVRGAIAGALAAGALYVAYLTVPTATVTLIPGTSTLGPEPVSIVASPNSPAVDVATGTVPAEWLKVPLVRSGTFEATGRDEVTTFARGKAVFTSKNTLTEVVIPQGTRISTVDGRDYKTTAQVVLPVWDGEPRTPKPRVEVAIQATRRGKDGNTGPDTIRTIKGGLGRLGLSVNNPDSVSGGDRFFREVVTAKDCKEARQTLTDQVSADLRAEAARPGTPGLTRFPTSATLGTPVLTPGCETLVGQTGETFDLRLETTGTVLEVDESVLETVAEQHFQLGLDPTLQIEPGSVSATTDGDPVVATDMVTFPMAVTALVTRPWDAALIRQQIAGKPVPEAKEILSDYGEATLVLWPDFVPNVPTDGGRITLVIQNAQP